MRETPHYEPLNLVTSVISPWVVSLKPGERMFKVRWEDDENQTRESLESNET